MATEEQLTGWTGPSSDTEQDKQDRTDRMITDAVNAHPRSGVLAVRLSEGILRQSDERASRLRRRHCRAVP